MPTRPLRPEREVRVFASTLRVEHRAEGDSAPSKIVGHAAVFDQWTVLYDGPYFTWREVIRPGAFRNALAESQDTLALFNHDKNELLGRSASGTLVLREDAKGLLVELDPPDTELGRKMAVLISRGDLKGMSFAFRVRPNGDRTTVTIQGEKEIEERELLDLDLEDVSIVTRPAYPQTDVAIRSLAELRDRPHKDPWLYSAWARLRLAEAQS